MVTDKIAKFDFIKIKIFGSTKSIIKHVEREATDWKIFAIHISYNWYPEYIEHPHNSVIIRQTDIRRPKI